MVINFVKSLILNGLLVFCLMGGNLSLALGDAPDLYASIKNNEGQGVEELLSEALDHFNAGENDLAIKKALLSISICKEFFLDSELLSRGHFIVAKALGKVGAFDEALFHRREQMRLYDGIKDSTKRELRWILTGVGGIYYVTGEYDSATFYFKKVLDECGYETGSMARASMMNNIGLSYLQKNETDSARSYFNAACDIYRHAKTPGDSSMLALVNINLSHTYKNNSENQFIIQSLTDTVLEIARDIGLRGVQVSALLKKSDLSLEMGHFEQSRLYLDEANALCDHISEPGHRSRNQMRVYEQYVKLFEVTREFELGLHYHKQFHEIYDSLHGEATRKKIEQSMLTYRLHTIELDMKLQEVSLSESNSRIRMLEKEEELSRANMLLFGAVGSFLLLFLAFFIFKLKSDIKKKRKLNEIQNRYYEESIKYKNDKLTASALILARKRELSNNLIQKLSEIPGVQKPDLVPIKQYVLTELDIDESNLEMEKYFSELSEEFFVKLKLDFPKLTDNDLKLCGLIRLKLSVKQIAIIKHITPESAKLAKNRLRKKMELEPGTILHDFLKSY